MGLADLPSSLERVEGPKSTSPSVENCRQYRAPERQGFANSVSSFVKGL